MKKTENRFDKFKTGFKNHPIGFILVVIFTIFLVLGVFTDSLDKTIGFLKKYVLKEKEDSPANIVQETKGKESPAVVTKGKNSSVIINHGDSAEQSIKQSITGNQSWAVAAGRDIIIINFYGMPEESVKITDKSGKIIKEFRIKDMKPGELERQFAETYRAVSDSSPEDAEEWAKHFVSTLPLRKEKLKTIEDDKRNTAEKEKMKLPIIFDYIFQNFDAKISALQKHIPDIRLERPDNYELIVDLDVSNSIRQYLTRKITFPNKHSIELILTPGTLEKGIFTSYPKLQFYEVANNRKKDLFFIHKSIGGTMRLGHPVMNDVSYSLDDSSLSERFKGTISTQFDKLIEIVYSGE